MERVADHLEMEKIRVSGSATASYIANNKKQSRGVHFLSLYYILFTDCKVEMKRNLVFIT